MTDNKGMQICSCNIPKFMIEIMRKLCEFGIAPSRSEYVRIALRNQIERDWEIIQELGGKIDYQSVDIVKREINTILQYGGEWA